MLYQHDLNMLTEDELPQMGMNIFKIAELPPAVRPNNIFCLLIHNVDDGIGDFAHGWDFANRIKPLLKEKGYELHAVVEATDDPNNPTSAVSWRGNYVKSKLEGTDSPFDSYLLFMKNHSDKHNDGRIRDAVSQWKLEHTEALARLKSQVVGAIEVSYPIHYLTGLMPEHVNIIKCYQYGYGITSDSGLYPSLSNATMGNLDQNGKQFYGIKLNDPDTDKRSASERLVALHLTEPEFVQALLNTDTPDIEKAATYLETHHFMPGYLQTNSGACAFILTEAMRYKDDGKVCDFHLPRNIIDRDVIIAILLKSGVIKSPGEIEFISPPISSEKNENAKIRVFSYRISKDEDYDTLFSISSDGAGASGDNSITLAFSGNHIPWWEFKQSPLGNFLESQISKFIESLMNRDDPRYYSNPELNSGMLKLLSYVYHVNRIRHYKLNPRNLFSEHMIFTQHGAGWETDEFDEIENVKSDDFIRRCQLCADLLKEPSMQVAWEYVSRHLHAHNFYDQLENIVKGSILTSAGPSDLLTACIANSKEIRNLIDKGVLSEDDIKGYDYNFLNFLASNEAEKLLLDSKIPVECLHVIFPEPNFELEFKSKLEKFITTINQLSFLNDDEKKILFKSSFLLIALDLDIIKPEHILKLKSALLTLPKITWPNLILNELIKNKIGTDNVSTAVITLTFKKPNLLDNLLSSPFMNHPDALKIVNDVLNAPPQGDLRLRPYLELFRDDMQNRSKVSTAKSGKKFTP